MTSVPQTAGALAARAASPDDQMVPRPFRVVRTRRDTRDTFTLELEPVDGIPLRFAAGQFTMLAAFGVGEVPISISGDPTSPNLLEHTIRNVGGVTATLVAAEPGTILGVRGPYGTGWGIADGMGAHQLHIRAVLTGSAAPPCVPHRSVNPLAGRSAR